MEPQRTRLNRLSPELFKDRATDSINLEVNWGGKRVAILERSLLDANGNRISRNLLEQLVVLYSRHENPEKLERLFKIEENQGVLFAKLMNYRPVYSVSEPISTQGVVIPSNLQPMSDKPMEWIEVDPIERRYGTSNPDWKPHS